MVTRVDHVSGGQWSVVTRVDHVSGGQWSQVSFDLKSTMDRPRGALTPDCTAVLNYYKIWSSAVLEYLKKLTVQPWDIQF